MSQFASATTPSEQSEKLRHSWTSIGDPFELRTVWLSRFIILVFACAMFVATWACWPDLVIDCGREMYVPWAILHGKQLYRDVWYPYGPFAPSIIALLLRTFGATLNTFYGTGLAIFAACAMVLHSIAIRLVPPIAALICALVFLGEGFQPSLFNYIVPYSYAATFMCLLCLLTLLFLLRYVEHKGILNLSMAGLCAALASISKMEAVLPCTAGILTALIFQAWRSQSPARILWPAIVSLLPGFFLSAIVFVWLCLQFKIDFLVHGNWQSMPGSYFMQTYGPSWIRRVGLRVVPAEIGELALECLGAAMFWVAIAWLSCKNRCFVVTAIVLVAAFPTHLFRGLAPGPHAMLSDAASALLFDLSFPRGMFLIAIVFLAISCIRAVCRRYPISAPMLVTIVMAIMLSFRVMVEIYPNGYALFSSPLLLVVFFAALWQTFLFVRQRMAPTSTAVPVFTYFLAYAFLFARAMSWGYYGIDLPLIQTPVGEVRRTQQNEILIDQFLPVVKEAKEKGQKVLLLPELTGLYFVAGILAPNRYELLLPGVLEPGKYTQEMLHELEITRPDLIIISNRRTSNYGVNYFGLDYDRDVLGWIEKNYRNVGEIGHFERSETAPLAGLLFRPK